MLFSMQWNWLVKYFRYTILVICSINHEIIKHICIAKIKAQSERHKRYFHSYFIRNYIDMALNINNRVLCSGE